MEASVSHLQPVLDDVLFPAVSKADVPTARVGLSGSVEVTMEELEAYGLGRAQNRLMCRVEILCRIDAPGLRTKTETVTDPLSGDREKVIEDQASFKLKVIELGSIEPTGEVWDGE